MIVLTFKGRYTVKQKGRYIKEWLHIAHKIPVEIVYLESTNQCLIVGKPDAETYAFDLLDDEPHGLITFSDMFDRRMIDWE